jgi:hypothetical protein
MKEQRVSHWVEAVEVVEEVEASEAEDAVPLVEEAAVALDAPAAPLEAGAVEVQAVEVSLAEEAGAARAEAFSVAEVGHLSPPQDRSAYPDPEAYLEAVGLASRDGP